MGRANVGLARASSYDDSAALLAAVRRSVERAGGLPGSIKPGARVFVKINHLSPPSPPERGIVTHPAFTAAVLELLKETGADLAVGDDISGDGQDGFAVSGYRQMCGRLGVRLVNLREVGFREVPCGGRLLKSLFISEEVAGADVIVNLPKLKTHSLTRLTGGVKNMFGVIPQGERVRLHGERPRIEDFSQALVDIFAAARPHFTIMDAVLAMEGEGPGSGVMREMGVVLAGRDAVAVDAIAARLIGLAPLDVLTTRYCDAAGLGTGKPDEIEVLGEDLDSLVRAGFKLPPGAALALARWVPLFLARRLQAQVAVRPSVAPAECTGCLACVRICPTGAALAVDSRAEIDRRACIKCMCCHEACRSGAITAGRPPAGRAIMAFVREARKLMPRANSR